MYVTTNSAVVWKRMADENRESARLLAKLTIGLFVMLLGVGAYAYSAHNKLNNLCQSISFQSSSTNSKALVDLATSVENGICA